MLCGLVCGRTRAGVHISYISHMYDSIANRIAHGHAHPPPGAGRERQYPGRRAGFRLWLCSRLSVRPPSGRSGSDAIADIALKSHPIRDSSPLTSCSRHRIEVDISTRSVCLGEGVSRSWRVKHATTFQAYTHTLAERPASLVSSRIVRVKEGKS